jgi:MscS family membrane protein
MKEFFEHPLYGQNTVAELCWCLGILLIALVFRNAITKSLVHFSFRFLKKYSDGSIGPDMLFRLMKKPFGYFILLVSLYLAFDRMSFPASWNLVAEDHFGIKMMLLRSFEIAFAISFTTVLFRVVDFIGLIMSHRSNLKGTKSNDQLIPFLKESVKVLLIIFSIFISLGSIFKINVASLIAGLGIGGLAVALAAKESIENLLGSFTIFLDKPFLVGDHVKTAGIEGTVESIGFRSTRIRTLEKTCITVPNKKMVDAELDNLSMRSNRRVRFILNIDYSTSPISVKKITEEILLLLGWDKRIMPDNKQVRLQEFGPASINLLVLFYLETTDGDVYLSVLEEVNYGIMEILERNGSQFAKTDGSTSKEKQAV